MLSVAENNPKNENVFHIYVEEKEIEVIQRTLKSHFERFLACEKSLKSSFSNESIRWEITAIERCEGYKQIKESATKVICRVSHYITIATTYRIIALDHLSTCKDISKVLYLDADMICIKDLSTLFSTDISSYVTAAVDEGENAVRQAKEGFGFAGDKYFNAGMMLINTSAWMKENIRSQALDLLTSRELRFADQDALNGACCGKVKWLNKINNMFSFNSTADEQLDAVILHYAESVKPWKVFADQSTNQWKIYKEYLEKYEPDSKMWYSFFKNDNALWYPESRKDFKHLAKWYFSKKRFFSGIICLIRSFVCERHSV